MTTTEYAANTARAFLAAGGGAGNTAPHEFLQHVVRLRASAATPTRRPHRGDRGGPAGEPVGRAADWPAGDQSVQQTFTPDIFSNWAGL
jgi:hypothetical protein